MVPTPPPCPTATTPQPTFAPSVPTEPITTEPESTELVFTEPESLFHPTTDHTLVDSIPADLTTDDSMPTEFLSDDVELISESVAPTTDKEVQSEDGLITGDIAAVVLAIILMIVLAIIALSVPIACGYFKKQSKTLSLPFVVCRTFSPYQN